MGEDKIRNLRREKGAKEEIVEEKTLNVRDKIGKRRRSSSMTSVGEETSVDKEVLMVETGDE